MKNALFYTLTGGLCLTLTLPVMGQRTQVLLIPIDGRPTSVQLPVRLGQIADVQVVTPPMALLGYFTVPARFDSLRAWLLRQPLHTFAAALVSVDMLAYGGAVPARMLQTPLADAQKRLGLVRTLRKLAPALPIYAQSVVMRLAPTGTTQTNAYRNALTRWAEVSTGSDSASRAETALLVQQLPPAILTAYRQTRARNRQINQRAIDLVQEGAINYLILTQDDAKEQGVHVTDQIRLQAYIRQRGVGSRVLLQPGADEGAMVLLARALIHQYAVKPTVRVVYSSEVLSQQVMPYEDRPLNQTVSAHIRAAGGRQVEAGQQVDLLFYVFLSRFEPGAADRFAERIASQLTQGQRVIVADIDVRGNIQGGDSTLMTALQQQRMLGKLSGYASWNTAANTIGTVLPQGLIRFTGQQYILRQSVARQRTQAAQDWFLIHRYLDDYQYHTVVRKAINTLAGQTGQSSRLLPDSTARQLEREALPQLTTALNGLYRQVIESRPGQRPTASYEPPARLRFSLPWNRTFEAAIDFDLPLTDKH